MSNLIHLNNVSLAYGLEPLLDQASLHIQTKDRICIIGRNGAGKSSLLKIMEGSIHPDSGQIYRAPGLKLARLPQELPLHIMKTVYEYVSEGLAETGQLLQRYHALTERISKTSSSEEMRQLELLQQQLDTHQGWTFKQKIETMLNRLDLAYEKNIAELSGGWQRRAALARVLVSSPDLVLLDEPTNHLDIEAIQWLEEDLLASQVGLVFITHDRSLLERLATRIVELDRGQLTSWPGDYNNFLRRKEEMLHAEAKHHAEFDKKLAQEEQWIRQGIKARRTRNEGRVRALEAMRLERSRRREVQRKAAFNTNEIIQSGQLVIEAQNISHVFSERTLIKHFSARVMRGDRIGLIGPNGAGKSTLINILLGLLAPTQGKVTLGTKLEIAYFDQLRQSIDPEKSVMENVLEGSEFIDTNGKRQHIMSYLSDFLFTPERARTPAKALSGGECNRLFLARLFSKPANLLVMDEPTNDLDIETLELLEELLSTFSGTLILVSHDRTFLNNVVTSTWAFEGDGVIHEYIGGYDDWLRQKPATMISSPSFTAPQRGVAEKPKAIHKLSYKDERELESLPKRIENLEKEQRQLEAQVALPDFYQQAPEFINNAMKTLSQISADLETAYQRWEELESRKNG